MGDNLVAVFFVEFLDKVYGLVGVEVAHEFTGDVLGLHVGEELVAVVFVELHEHVGGLVAPEELVEIFGLVEVEVVVELGDVGGVELVEEFARLGIVVFGDDFADVVEIFFVNNRKAPLWVDGCGRRHRWLRIQNADGERRGAFRSGSWLARAVR